jgi:hypothetical protein
MDQQDDKCATKTLPTGTFWLYSTDHIHCDKCSSILNQVGQLSWNVESGVGRVGYCPSCDRIYIQREKTKHSKWIQMGEIK